MKARKTTREEALKTKLNASTKRLPLVVTYNPALPNLHKILDNHQHILHTSSKCQTIFKETLLVAYRRGRSLSQMLTNKRLPPSNTSDPNDSNDHSIRPIDKNILNPCETNCRICGSPVLAPLSVTQRSALAERGSRDNCLRMLLLNQSERIRPQDVDFTRLKIYLWRVRLATLIKTFQV